MAVFLPRFDHVVLLTAPVEVTVARLARRSDDPYGKRPEEVAAVLANLREVEPRLRAVAGHEIASLLDPPEPEVGGWRFMVDERHQGRGIGREALLQVIAHVRAKRGFKALELSYVPGPGCPEPFYRSLGFQPTGRMEGDEVVLELTLGEAESG